MAVVKLESPEPKSPQAVIDLLRGQLERASKERLVYLEVVYKYAGERSVSSVSITCPQD